MGAPLPLSKCITTIRPIQDYDNRIQVVVLVEDRAAVQLPEVEADEAEVAIPWS